MGNEKRQRLDATGERLAGCRALLAELESIYGQLQEEFLWDVDKFQNLILPRIGGTGENVSNEFTYIGRVRAKALYERVLQLIRGNTLVIPGAKGSGKSTVVAAIVGFLLVKHKRRVVYLSAGEFCRNPVAVLRDALLVATGGDMLVADLDTMEELDLWCEKQRIASEQQRLLFVVDDWDKFESYPSLELLLEGIASRYHILIKLSSSNSRDRILANESDKPPLSFQFDGPYTGEELLTWISQSHLSADMLKDLDYLTGGMPWLLRLYDDVGGDAARYRLLIEEEMYTRKVYERLVERQTSRRQLAALVQLVTRGELEVALARPFDLSLFYKDEEGKLRPLSPFLRFRLESYIMDSEVWRLEKAIHCWIGTVIRDCSVKGRNPARAGWNLEGLIIAVMRYQGKLWGDLDFKHVRMYEHGCEAQVLGDLVKSELLEGVFVVPINFNEEVLDVLHIRLRGETLEVKPVQITVSLWKHKRKKRSHSVWQEKVLPQWLAEEYAVKHQFVYLMPKTLTKEELDQVESDLVEYVEKCRAAPSSEPYEMETDMSEVYDAEFTDLRNVVSEPPLFKNFGDVHECLKEFDRKVRLGEGPEPPERKSTKQCGGFVVQGGVSRPCKRWRRTDDETWYCCPAHTPVLVSSPPE